MESEIKEKDLLELQFGFSQLYEPTPRLGWLLNYQVEKNEFTRLSVALYFVDEQAKNFRITVPYYPSFLVACQENDYHDVEENFVRRYEGKVHHTEPVSKIDVAEHNHLNKPPRNFVKFYIRSESDFLQIIRENTNQARSHDDVYAGFSLDIERTSYKLYEYDIPMDVQAANSNNIRCGTWYEVSYNGTEYKINKSDKIIYPDLRIMAFDIETTKPPLKFPNPESDCIMMISILTESFGLLIVNREIISADIQEFEYEAKEDMRGLFRIANEKTEEGLLIRFIECIQQHTPHIITTYNGGFFDWPFIDKRAQKYGISLASTISYKASCEYYDSPFIPHLDCYKWVKRDSYLPMNNQGLKDAARIKLGYCPDEIDPEDMVRFAREEPQKLASYSVSDAVATYFLYVKYVHPHVFSIGSLIPLPAVQILCRESGTLCEALLFAESINFKVLVPSKKKPSTLEYYKGHIVENLTYIGGHVEYLRAGVFRSDFDHQFKVDNGLIDMIVDNLNCILEEYLDAPTYEEVKQGVVGQLLALRGNITDKGSIWHLDVGAMYPNIILTNRLQPISVVTEDVCIHCDFNSENNRCKRRMEWHSRAEYIPPPANEINMIKNQLQNETFYTWNESEGGNKKAEQTAMPGENSEDSFEKDCRPRSTTSLKTNKFLDAVKIEASPAERVPYHRLPVSRQEAILKERVVDYSKKIYKKGKKIETMLEEITICQREVPFYVETVRKFSDQRNIIKDCYKAAMKDYERDPSLENKKKIVLFNSMQIAYKCVLNSFYGYVMRTGSRWFSLEMAATVCHVGGKIIRLAKDFLERVGIPLELDTDGIWCLLPARFPTTIKIGSSKVSLLSHILNYFVCKKFTNDQYQTKTLEGYSVLSQNSIAFEADGPYKSMVIPSSTEENRLLKKRYAVFDENNSIAELKGFELKRRGELNFVKKFQEDLFSHFNDGNTLQECYAALGRCCNYWYDIIHTEGRSLDDEAIFELFSESRNMSKCVEVYGNRKTSILNTARRLSQFLGKDLLEDKLKCEFIISKYPENAPTTERCIPVLIFRHPDKNRFLKQWLKNGVTDLRIIVDWQYYKKRFESILQRMILIPAYFQKIPNPIQRLDLPKWVRDTRQIKLGFEKLGDIEDVAIKRSLTDIFYQEINKKSVFCTESGHEGACSSEKHAPLLDRDTKDLSVADIENPFLHEAVAQNSVDASEARHSAGFLPPILRCIEMHHVPALLSHYKERWLSFYHEKSILVKTTVNVDGTYTLQYLDGRAVSHPLVRKVLLDTNEAAYFDDLAKVSKCLPHSNELFDCFVMEIPEAEIKLLRYKKFFEHFLIKAVYNDKADPLYELFCVLKAGGAPSEYLVISSFAYRNKRVYCITHTTTIFISELKIGLGDTTVPLPAAVHHCSLKEYRKTLLGRHKLIIFNKNDPNHKDISREFEDVACIPLELTSKMFLEGIASLMRIQCDLHLKMKEKYQELADISKQFDLPICNANVSNILDLIYYKEMARANTICVFSTGFINSVFREETYKPTYCSTYSIQLECVETLLLSIIEYNLFSNDRSFHCCALRQDFVVLREMLRKLLIASLKNNHGAASLLKNITFWLKKGSGLMSVELRELLNSLQQKYMVNLIVKLKELQCKVVSVSKELIIIDSGKNDAQGCQLYCKYIKDKVAAIPGYELLNLHPIRTFEKLAFVNPTNYFYIEASKIKQFSGICLPEDFLSLYLEDSEFHNEQVYDMVTQVSRPTARMMLRLIAQKKDTHLLVSNCYKLIRTSVFEENKEYESNLTVFCSNCRLENLLRKRCLKCYTEVDRSALEETCLQYLNNLWELQIGGGRCCSSCGATEERKLKEYCRCGGKFVLKDHSAEIEGLRAFVNTKRFDETVATVLDYCGQYSFYRYCGRESPPNEMHCR